MPSEPSETVEAIHRLKQEIDKLSEQQNETLKTATFLGMTPDEATEYDDRREQITKLIQELALLGRAQ